jgi:hypothetical protein
VVLAHDVFLRGSRRFSPQEMPVSVKRIVEGYRAAEERAGRKREIELYNTAAGHHEHLVAKYCSLLGTTLSGVIAREDRGAVGYLRSRPDVMPDRIGCVGYSGGGCRAACSGRRATVWEPPSW